MGTWEQLIIAFDTDQMKVGDITVGLYTITSNPHASFCPTCGPRTLQELKECPSSPGQWIIEPSAVSATEQQEMLLRNTTGPRSTVYSLLQHPDFMN